MRIILIANEEFEDTRIRKTKMNRQRNGQMKNYNMTNIVLQNIHVKLWGQITERSQTKTKDYNTEHWKDEQPDVKNGQRTETKT